ncbi:SGNH/GDSL hydrolase family protein [Autumnicola psychrophila]|uniref:SGNH/GDSL hydrolase family protein n=1 Tax=Autumnicola psychrophila TaxID=3075592 RepID=A0ABU3DSZ9_9FLAO|nr:SGNH/GDSL hydrolase family protein [Zunongwangia sp. F225]MDT0686815.1 SGNH/GDSL hydrolase family protein [Zunongwangia sp. F225]
MKRITVFLLVAIVLISCNSTSDTTNSGEVDSGNMDYSYLALGDSYTIGESVAVDERWPVQLVEALRERGYKFAPPKIIAKTGWTTQDLLRGIENDLNVQRDFDLVSILIGVNNQYQNKPIDEYEVELREVFRKAINHSKTREEGVFALSIPDYGATPFGQPNAEVISEEIDEYNAVFRQVAEDYEVDFYNITPISREAERDPDLVAQDGLHPSALMYRYWVEDIVGEVAEKIPNNIDD